MNTFNQVADTVLRRNIQLQIDAGIDMIGVGDFTFYDHILDWIHMLGLVPDRFLKLGLSPLDTYFAMARGAPNTKALDMSKWLNQNYHYEIPELSSNMPSTKADFSKLLEQVKTAIGMAGKEKVVPIIFGPCTLVNIAKILDGSDPATIVRSLLPKYVECLKMLAALGVQEVQVHDPVLVKSGIAAQWKPIFEEAYKAMSQAGIPLNLVTYFDDLEESWSFVCELPVAKISMDFTTGNNLDIIKAGKFPKDKQLGAGVVDSLTPFVLLGKASSTLSELAKCGLAKPLIVQASSSLMYLPYDVNAEPAFSPELKQTLGFAIQKLTNIVFLAKGGQGPSSSGIPNKPVVVPDAFFSRKDPAQTRLALQATELNLPKLWTSSIGSFPQMPELRAIRLKFRKGEVSEEEYDKKVNEYISYCVGIQEAVGLDVLVHGEPERSDMVEYFAEQLDGFAFSQYGWVQSYGSRYTRPPIVIKDITHVKPMTVKEWKVSFLFVHSLSLSFFPSHSLSLFLSPTCVGTRDRQVKRLQMKQAKEYAQIFSAV